MRIFLDANILFTAAHRPTGKSALLIELGAESFLEVVTCKLTLEEADRNLAIKFADCRGRLARLAGKMEIVDTVVRGHCPVALPEKDRPILLSAMGSKCTHLLTGDSGHFGRYFNQLQRTGGVLIQTVGQFPATL